MNEFIYGWTGGVIGTIISHPVDTIRINLQSSKAPKYTFRGLYKGILTPILGIGIEKAYELGNRSPIRFEMTGEYLKILLILIGKTDSIYLKI